MPPDRQFSRAQRRTYHALVAAGLELLLENGYDALTITAITRRADYGRSTFYLYFRDKEDFIWTILRDQLELIDEYILAEVAGLEYPERERRAWTIIFEQIEQTAAFWLNLDGDTSHELRQRQRQLSIEQFERNLRAGNFQIPFAISPELGARFLVGTVQEILEYWMRHPEIGDAQTMADLMCTIVYRIPPDDQH